MTTESVIEYLSTGWLMALLLWPLYTWLEWRFPHKKSQDKLPKFRQIVQDLFWDRCDDYLAPLVISSISFVFYSYFYTRISTGWHLTNDFLSKHKLDISFAPIQLKNPVIQIIIIFLMRDFSKYIIHLCFHRNSILWRFHILHHSSETLNWISVFRTNWTESIVWTFGSILPTLLINTPPLMIGILSIMDLHLAFIGHANVKFTFGPLKKIMHNPVTHHWHHSKESIFSGGQNFGTFLLIWDQIFHTYHCPSDYAPPAIYGVADENHYPKSVIKRFIYPFYKMADTPSVGEIESSQFQNKNDQMTHVKNLNRFN